MKLKELEAKPNMDKLIEKTNGSKYTLVAIAGKRARMIAAGDNPRVNGMSHKPVVIALQEIASDKMTWGKQKPVIKNQRPEAI